MNYRDEKYAALVTSAALFIFIVIFQIPNLFIKLFLHN